MRKFKILSLFIFVCALIASTSVVFAAAGDVWIFPNSKTVNASSTFDLEVLVNTGTQKLGAYQFAVTFDKALVNVNGVDAGVDGFVTTVNINNDMGSLIVNGFYVNGKGPGTSLRVLTIHFKALGNTGIANIGLSVSTLADDNGTTIGTPSGQGATVTILTPQHTLSVTVNPSNGSTVAGNGINCPGDCSETYDKGTNVTLTATPNNSFVLDHWSGCDSTNGNQCTISMNSNKSVNVYFNAILGLPVPSGHNIYSYLPVETAIINSGNPFLCKPFAVGDVVGGTLSLQVKIPPFSGPVDIYLALYTPQADRENLYMITSNLSLQPLSMGFVPWRENTYGDIDETIADIDTSVLSPGIYYLYLVVTPTGSIDSFYLWTTYFVSPTFVIP